MSAPSDNRISFGKVHRTLRELPVMVRDYTTLSVEITILPCGSLLQPWPLLQQGYSSDIPITLGGQSSEFDWGVTSHKGHFLSRDNFFFGCEAIPSLPNREIDARLHGALRYWKATGGRHLLQGAPLPWPPGSPGSVRLFNGQIVDSASEFYLVDAQGRITQTFPVPRLYGRGEKKYIADIYAVVDGHFCCYLWQQAGPNDTILDMVSVFILPVTDCGIADLPFDL